MNRIGICKITMISFFFILLFSQIGLAYTPLTDKCVGCHEGTIASYRRPHNDTIMCEQCHTQGIHTGYSYIQPDGTFTNNKSTAATCVDCHEIGVPGFNAPIIPNMKHSSNINNGSIWGNYWNSEKANSCKYCHGNTMHDMIALGKIYNLTDDPTNLKKGAVDTTTWCADCHYNGTANSYYNGDLWSPIPPLIDTKNTNNDAWIDHNSYLTTGYNDIVCKSCHSMIGEYAITSANYTHSIGEVSGDACIECHGTNYTGESPGVSNTFVDIGIFNNSIHRDINSTPIYTVNNNDCWTCHFNKDMSRQNVRKCGFCHLNTKQWHGDANVTTNLTDLSKR